jgi:hypothetical protein
MDDNTTKNVGLPVKKVEPVKAEPKVEPIKKVTEPAKKAEEPIKKAEKPVKRESVSPQGEIPYIVVSNDGVVISLRDARGVKTSIPTPEEYKDAKKGQIVYIKKEE